MNKGLILLAALCVAVPAWAGRVNVSGVSASSEYEGEGNYAPKKVADGRVSTSWVEGDEGSGLGSWVELDLGGEHKIGALRVWGGDWFSGDSWSRANRPKELEIKFSDESTEVMTLTDEMVVQEHKFDKPVSTTSVRVKVKGVYSGSTWHDTVISEIQVVEAGRGGVAQVSGFNASTTLPADNDGSYDPKNVSDGIVDSMWCEGSKDGDGTGDWLEFNFGGSTSVSSIGLVNGIGTSLPFWMKGNRATAAQLTFSDGSTEDITIKNSMLPQTVSFSPHQTSSVKLTFTGVAKGKEYNDLCISEAYFK